MKLVGIVCIDATKEEVWRVLADVAAVDQWVGVIESAYCESEQTTGVGTKRVCHLSGGVTVIEEWTMWDEGNSFTYRAIKRPFMIKTAYNTWSVESVNGQTLLKTESEVVLKGGIFGKLLEPLMRMLTTRMGDESLVAFKYLVENGEPYQGPIADLPNIPVTC
ncbi:MAG: SRPBCC family protein [Chloroflexota bacterium]